MTIGQKLGAAIRNAGSVRGAPKCTFAPAMRTRAVPDPSHPLAPKLRSPKISTRPPFKDGASRVKLAKCQSYELELV